MAWIWLVVMSQTPIEFNIWESIIFDIYSIPFAAHKLACLQKILTWDGILRL